ncbi:hypothetical protein NEOLEDRAFT_470179 [Neolentinus lepideus HHB14362 ss-1]|uniref:PX domain-containing protein n=1 Tax=Neolentinus lepideus HHB14362 ss-1 TaxID=1314782 RepID=A0A165VIW5_9AGAM|nr:hypothetical protein NEOLEDRAFT_470179 [Neolentinus lepideus HHB14362 ss-1]
MLMSDFTTGPGQVGGPPNPNAFKRAVYRLPPANFYVEMLSPTKHGSNYSYGMRVCPVGEGADVQSMRSDGSHKEYEIWRRWEDCLWFQDTLELEYSVLSREKRNRLQAGKGVKKNGMYIHDVAASFESLPPGPDPNSIARDIHEYIPTLTKKGTLFRASQATIEQRQKEFSALIEALLREDVPTLIKELRESRQIRDFFGYWRRDRDLARKSKESVGKSARASIASSAFSTYFSASALSLQFPPLITTDVPPSPSQRKPFVKTQSTSPGAGPSSPGGQSILQTAQASGSRHALTGVTFNLSNKSSSSEDFSSGSSSHGMHSTTDLRRTEREHAVAMASGSVRSSDSTLEEPTFALHALPEESELTEPVASMSISEQAEVPPPVRRRTRTISHDRSNRNGLVFTAPPRSPTVGSSAMSQISERPSVESMRSSIASPSMIELSESIMSDNRFGETEPTSPSSRRSSMVFSSPSSRRSSWQTAMSDIPPRPASSHESYYSRTSCADLDLPFTRSRIILHTPLAGDSAQRQRASTISMLSIRTESSADAIIPRTGLSPPTAGTSSLRRSLSVGSRRYARFSYPTSVMEEGEGTLEDGEDLIDAYLYSSSLSEFEELPSPTSPRFGDNASGPSTPGPSTPGHTTSPLPTPGREQIHMNLSNPEYFPKPFQNRPPGQYHIPWSPKGTEHNTGNPAEASFAVKAVHGETIIVFRTSRMTSFIEIRKKLVDKFSQQEEAPLAHTFALAYLPHPSERTKSIAGRPRSSSVSSVGVSDTTLLRYISSQDSWDEAIATCGGKLTLRLID